MDRKLNKRQLTYCYYRARDFTIEQAMEKAGFTGKGNTARAVGSRLETNANIKERIECEVANIFDVSKIDLEYLVNKANEIAQNSLQDTNKLRAIEILAKLKGLWIDKQQVDASIITQEEEGILSKYITNRVSSLTPGLSQDNLTTSN
jgi:phage terminase small subunit